MLFNNFIDGNFEFITYKISKVEILVKLILGISRVW